MAGKRSVHFSKSANQTLYINQSSEEEDADDEESFADDEEQGEEKETNNEKIASGDGSVTNPAWADAMAKLLGSSVSKKSGFMLAKAKKDGDLVDKPKKPVSSFEVVSEDGKADVVTSQVKSNDDSTSKKKGRLNPKAKVLEETLKTVDKCDREKELRLAAIATKGVVQLFNAVNAQLNQIEKTVDEAGPLEGKQKKAREAIDEKSFMQTLEKMNEDVTPAPEDDDDEEERDEPRKKRSRKKDKNKQETQNFSKVFSDNFAVAL